LKRLREASVQEIALVAGFGPDLAARVHSALAERAAEIQPAVNMTTGEVIG
jgi:hypothetical protein